MAFPTSSGSPSVVVLWCSTLKISLNFPKFSSSHASLLFVPLQVSLRPTPAFTCWVLSSMSLFLFILHPCKVTGLLFGAWDTEIISVEANNFFSQILVLHISNRFLVLFRKPGCVGLIPRTAFGMNGQPGPASWCPFCFHDIVEAPGLGCSSSRWEHQGLTLELLPQEGKGELFWSNKHQVPLVLWTCAAKSLKPWT